MWLLSWLGWHLAQLYVNWSLAKFKDLFCLPGGTASHGAEFEFRVLFDESIPKGRQAGAKMFRFSRN